MKVYLASKSPRRKELLKMLNIDFEILDSNTDETLNPDLSLAEQSKNLAFSKAKAVFDKTTGDRIVIGADTIVFKDGIYYGKPSSQTEAFDMISNLMDSTHQVSTGFAVLVEKDGIYQEFVDCDICDVHIVKMTPSEINDWISSGKALDKAGAYSIQDEFCKFIDRIDGNYHTVVGLPVHLIYQVISKYYS